MFFPKVNMSTHRESLVATLVCGLLIKCSCAYSACSNGAACDSDDNSQQHSLKKIEKAVRKCDTETLREANAIIFRAVDASESVRFLADKWNQSIGPTTDRSSCLSDPQLRIYVAETLAEGYSNGMPTNIDINAVRRELSAALQSTDVSIAYASITGLGAIANREDLPLLAKIVSTGKDSRRTAAIQALASQCSPEATRVLDELEARPNNADVASQRAKLSFVRKARCRETK